ncbi:MAG: esterase-like activity of phytase family protein [Inquilinaceae bacterium]
MTGVRRAGRAGPVIVTALIAAVVVACAPAPRPDPAASTPVVSGSGLDYRGGVRLDLPSGIGGLSALAIDGDGGGFVALSDEGQILTGRMHHDDSGRLVRVDALTVHPLGGIDAEAPKRRRDAEAMTRSADGSWLVAFERDHRLLAYPPGADGLRQPPSEIAPPPGLARLPANKGVEALAMLPDGRLIAIGEAASGSSGDHTLWIRQPLGDWDRKTYRTDGAFAPTDAVALADGDVLVLERSFGLFSGLRARVIRVPASELDNPAVIGGYVVGTVEPPLGISNFEGLALSPTHGRPGTIYVVSDDNRSPLLDSLLVQYVLSSTDGIGS